jgi:hypothetical protein
MGKTKRLFEEIRELETININDMINNQEFFDGSLPAGFDGLFDWDTLIKYCFPYGSKEALTDIDAVNEKNVRFLHFETKSKGSKIPIGQLITIDHYHVLGCVTQINLTFDQPDKNLNYISKIGVWYPNDKAMVWLDTEKLNYKQRLELLINTVIAWRKDADKLGNLTIHKDYKSIRQIQIMNEISKNSLSTIIDLKSEIDRLNNLTFWQKLKLLFK